MKPDEPAAGPAPDASSRWIALGMTALVLLGILTVFGTGLWALVTGDVSVQNP